MPVPIPGIKLGLANLVVLFLLLHAGVWQALALSLGRVLLSSLLFSGFSGFVFSASGALLSWAVMALLVRSRMFSPVSYTHLSDPVQTIPRPPAYHRRPYPRGDGLSGRDKAVALLHG